MVLVELENAPVVLECGRNTEGKKKITFCEYKVAKHTRTELNWISMNLGLKINSTNLSLPTKRFDVAVALKSGYGNLLLTNEGKKSLCAIIVHVLTANTLSRKSYWPDGWQ